MSSVKELEKALKVQANLLVASRARDQEKGSRLRVLEREVLAGSRELASLQKHLDIATKFRKTKVPVKYSGRPSDTKKREGNSAVILLSDWHAEETITPAEVGGVNEYSWDIMSQRAENVLHRSALLTDDARNLANIDHAVLFLLGDFIHGAIHEDNLMSTSRTPVEATVQVAGLLESWIAKYFRASGVERLDVCCQPGNHSRARQKKFHVRKNQQTHEYMMYKYLASKIQENHDGIYFHVPECSLGFINIRGYRFRYLHGDHPGIGGSGVASFIPGACNVFNKWDRDETENLQADHTVFGDRHQFCHPGDIARWTANGCLCGFNTYCLNGFSCTPVEPSQTFMVVDPSRRVTRAMPIFCD